MLVEIDFPRAEFIALLAYLTKRQKYLELGLDGGHSFATVARVVNESVGVCISPIRVQLPSTSKFYNMTTDKFFESEHDYSPDLIFIDADHHYEQVKKDLYNTLNIMSDDAIILLHDTDPESEFFVAQDRCGDAYKIIDELSDLGFYHITLPMEEAGITIATKSRRVLSFI